MFWSIVVRTAISADLDCDLQLNCVVDHSAVPSVRDPCHNGFWRQHGMTHCLGIEPTPVQPSLLSDCGLRREEPALAREWSGTQHDDAPRTAIESAGT